MAWSATTPRRRAADHRPLAVVARRAGEIVGGLLGHTHWGWLFVRQLGRQRKCGQRPGPPPPAGGRGGGAGARVPARALGYLQLPGARLLRAARVSGLWPVGRTTRRGTPDSSWKSANFPRRAWIVGKWPPRLDSFRPRVEGDPSRAGWFRPSLTGIPSKAGCPPR